MAKKAPKGSATKTEAITLRVNPRVKFGLELLARQQHRTLSSVLEWAIAKIFENPDSGLQRQRTDCLSNAEGTSLLDEVWDPEEADRLVKLAIFEPRLLTYPEDLLWKQLRENRSLWNREFGYDKIEQLVIQEKAAAKEANEPFDAVSRKWELVRNNLHFNILRASWKACKQFLDEEIESHKLKQAMFECRTSVNEMIDPKGLKQWLQNLSS